MPWWLGDPGFHEARQSNLIRKAPEFYGPLWPMVSADLPYVWPEEIFGPARLNKDGELSNISGKKFWEAATELMRMSEEERNQYRSY